MNLLLLGVLFLVGLLADLAGRFTPLPRVSVLLLSGLAIGPAGLGWISEGVAETWFPTFTQMALAMIGFLIGQNLSLPNLRRRGVRAAALAAGKVVCTSAAVFFTAVLLGVPVAAAAALAGIAGATAPAAIFDVVHEMDARGPFKDLLLDIVAMDDAWGLMVFAILIAFATSGDAGIATGMLEALTEIGGSVLLGAVLGLPMALLTGRITFGERPGEPILAESLGFVFVAAGLSALLDLSPILTALSMGSVVAGVARHHAQPFNAIEGVEWPFMILFFLMAGASLHLEYLGGAVLLVLAYIMARTFGTLAGIRLFGAFYGLGAKMLNRLGASLLPQAGVALGMALIAAQRLPEHAQLILTVAISSTVMLEVVSPPITRAVIKAAQAESVG